jgi:type II secretory pathway pseudopilin PulG
MQTPPRRADLGYAMAALLVALGVMSVVLGMAMPVWRTVVQREKEEELVFRGRQYARAIQLYQRKYAAAYPASVDLLVEQKFLRKKYKDPITNGDFEIIYQGTLAQRQAASAASAATGRGGASTGTPPAAGRGMGPGQMAGGPGQTVAGPGASVFGSQAAGPQGGVVGVASKSKEKSIRVLDGRTVYSEWVFVFTPAPTTRTGPAGSGPGGRGAQPGAARPGVPRGRGAGAAGNEVLRPPG